MSDYNNINGTGENTIQSSCEKSDEVSLSPKTLAKDESPKADDQKSPKKSPHKEECPKVLVKESHGSPKVSVEDTPEKDKDTDELKCFKSTPDKDKTGEKSLKGFSDIVDKFDPDLDSSESFPEETSSEILGEDTPEKYKSSESFAKDTLDKDESEKNISELSGGDVFQDNKNLLSPKPHLISKSTTVPAENEATVEKLLESPEKSVTVPAEDKATEDKLLESPEKSVTVPAEDKATEDKLLESPEKRKFRINRRGFRQQSASCGDSDAVKSEKADKSGIVNLDSKKKMISLSSVKSTSYNMPVDKVDKKKIILKRKLSLSSEEEEKNEPTKGADDPPKKKKHKPITWP